MGYPFERINPYPLLEQTLQHPSPEKHHTTSMNGSVYPDKHYSPCLFVYAIPKVSSSHTRYSSLTFLASSRVLYDPSIIFL